MYMWVGDEKYNCEEKKRIGGVYIGEKRGEYVSETTTEKERCFVLMVVMVTRGRLILIEVAARQVLE